MGNYYKYLPVSDEDRNWGLYVLNAGSNRIQKEETYPPVGHPSHHNFNWEQGRIFDEYQLIYISRGEGIFESESCPQTVIKEGTVLLLFPQEWHRFKPNPATGWDESWAGFDGNIVGNLVQQRFISRNRPLLEVGLHDTILTLLTEIIEKTKTERPGYQAVISGIVLHLLGFLHSLTKQAALRQEDISESLVNKARLIIRSYAHQHISIEKIAEELQVSYAWLRKAFKLYTGTAPGQYLLHLKIDNAKILLADPTKPIKEIAFETGFESALYFSKIFKIKTGISPELYRKKLQARGDHR